MNINVVARNIQKNLLYLNPAWYASHSGSVYLFLPHGVIRVSDHDTGKPVKWKVYANKYKAKGRRCYGTGEIGLMINDIKRELNSEEFAV